MDFSRRQSFSGRYGRYGQPSRNRPPGRINKIIIIALVLVTVSVFFWLYGRYWWQEKRWRYIVIHHTASDTGNLEYYREMHRKRGWPDIAYHFLINNGSLNTAMGQIQQSSLWEKRDINYSSRVSWVNYFGIAIGLVGNFEKHRVPPLQKEALINLAAGLAERYDIPPERIIGHREIQNTACPGRFVNLNEVREAVRAVLNEK